MKNNEEKENKKEKKPIYKRWWFISIIFLIIFGYIIGREEKVEWSSLSLSEYLPEPTKGKIKVGSNLEDYLSLSIDNVKTSYYEKYLDVYIKNGYTIESKKSGQNYEAFNDKGYELNINYARNDIHIILKSPEKMENITWPTEGLGMMLPVPKSNFGKVKSDSSSTFRIHIGNTTINDFINYIEECKIKGFTIDYDKKENIYYAKNSQDYRLNLEYLGFNTIDILIQEPQKNDTSADNNSNNNSTNNNDIRKDFKSAMDKYEEFMNEYIEFMKKYKDSNGTDFYLEVQTRVNKKLLEIAN